jgi:hypothetical protein
MVGDSAAAFVRAHGVNLRGLQHPVAVFRFTVKSDNPAKQALLDRMWAPYWEHLPIGAMDDETNPFPGRRLARDRRSEKPQAVHTMATDGEVRR